MLRHKSGLTVIDRTLDHMHLISSGVGLNVRLTSVGDRAHSDNDTGHFDMTGQPSDITLSLILIQGNNFKLKRKLFPMFPVYWYISRKCMHLQNYP